MLFATEPSWPVVPSPSCSVPPEAMLVGPLYVSLAVKTSGPPPLCTARPPVPPITPEMLSVPPLDRHVGRRAQKHDRGTDRARFAWLLMKAVEPVLFMAGASPADPLLIV